MYSVIQPIEVLDDNDDMVSTWMVLETDLGSKETGYAYIDDNVEEELKEHTWVVKTSDILKFTPDVLQHIVIGFGDDEDEKSLDALLAAGDYFPAM